MVRQKHSDKQKAKSNIFTYFLFLVLVAVVACAALYHRQPPPKFSGPVEHVTTGNVGEYSSLSIIAQKQGYFKQYGIDVTMKEYASGPPAVADVLAGKVDFATAADFVGVSNGFLHANLRIVATQLRAESFYMAARTDHGIHAIADLKGKKIGVTAKTAGQFYFGDFMILNGMQLSDAHLSFDTPDGLVSQLEQGKLDAIVSFDPHIYKVQQQLGSSITVWSMQGDEKLSSLLYSSEAYIRQHPEVATRYLQALVAAENFAASNNRAAEDIVGNYLHFDHSYMERVWPRLDFDVSLDQDLLIRMDDEARWAIENKVVDASQAPDYLKMIYFKGMEAAKPDGITIIR